MEATGEISEIFAKNTSTCHVYLCSLGWFVSLLLEARYKHRSTVEVTSIQRQCRLDWVRAGELNIGVGIGSLAGRSGLDKTNLSYGTTLG